MISGGERIQSFEFFAQDGQSVVKLVILNQLRERNEARVWGNKHFKPSILCKACSAGVCVYCH